MASRSDWRERSQATQRSMPIASSLPPGARIGGDLLYAGQNKPEVPEGAVVNGEIRQIETEMPIAEDFVPKSRIW